MFEKYLQEIGLSEKEAVIYLALLQVDNESIQDLAKRTEINRTTVYPVLETLEKKGLVNEVQFGKKTHYEAAAPERLETFVERQKTLLAEKSKRLKDIIPELKGIQRKEGERPVIKFFEGRDGVVSAYEEFYSTLSGEKQDGFLVYNMDLLKKTYSEEENEHFYQIRAKRNITPNAVYNKAEGDHTFITPGNRFRIDEKKYPISTDITIVNDQVILSTLGDHISSFIIKSKDIAMTLKSLVAYINDSNKKGA
ncbi:MAG: BlaI/MecI/CopY family transcriptional regulator [Candidatus Pacebacteria bacterium]|nr:BlaI/MecI/CopY family transcriptional regulator [Candidatus Paceibacterota bacterium]